MKKAALLIIYIYALLCQSCQEHMNDLPMPPREAERTVIVYVVGENSLAGYAVADSLEMVMGIKDIPDNCNLVLYSDRNLKPSITWMSKENGVRHWKTFAREQDSADSLTMLHTLQEIVATFPAKHYGLVLWSHASGWTPRRKTFGIDNNINSSYSNAGSELEIPTLRGVLEQLPHTDYILMDACLMQQVEVAYELRKVTDYLIGSPSEIPGDGAPYHCIMSPLMKGDAVGIAEAYYQYYIGGKGVALSVVDCSMMDSLAHVTAPLTDSIWSGRREVSCDNVQHYHPFDTNQHRPEGQDIRGMMHALLPDSTFQAWERVLLSTVVWHKATPYWESIYKGYEHSTLTHPELYSGLSLFVPQDKYEPYGWNTYFEQTSWYHAAGWASTGW